MKVLYFLSLLSILLFSASCSPQPKSVAEQDALDEVKRTIRLGADPHSLKLRRYLNAAIRDEYISVVHCLLDAGVPIPIDAMENVCSNLELLKLLHKRGAKGENEALYAAASHGYSESVEYLVSIGATNLDEAMEKAYSRLLEYEKYRRYGDYSAEKAHPKFSKIVKFLFQKGAKPTTDTIRRAIKADDIVFFKRLLARCYPKKLLKHKVFLRSMDFHPLQEALAEALNSNGKHRNEMIQILMEYPQVFDINSYFAALKRKEFAIAEILLQKYDRDKNEKYIEKRLVYETLPVAVEHRQKELIRLLFQKVGGNLGSNKYFSRGHSQHLLEKAVKNNDPGLLELLLFVGFSFDVFKSDEILLHAIKTNDPKMVNLLLNAGIQFTSGELAAAVQNNSREIIDLLLAYHFAPAKIRDNNYLKQELTEAMLVSAEKNDVRAVHFFLTSGAYIFRRSERKKVPLYTFVSEQNKACKKLLSDANLIYETATAYLQALRKRDEDAARKMFVEGDFDAKGKYKYYFWREQRILVHKKDHYERIQNILQLDRCKISDDTAKMYIQQTLVSSLPKIQWVVRLKKINNVWYISNIADLSVSESDNKKIEQLAKNVPERPVAFEIIGLPGTENDGLLVHDLILEFNKIIINDHPINKINSELQKSKSSFTVVYTARLSNGKYIFTRHTYRNGFPKVSFHPILLPKDKKEKLINEFVRFKVREIEILPPHTLRLYQRANAHYKKGEIKEAVRILTLYGMLRYPQVKWLLGNILYRQKGYELRGRKLCIAAWNEVQYLPAKK